jgi:hypothetical protein
MYRASLANLSVACSSLIPLLVLLAACGGSGGSAGAGGGGGGATSSSSGGAGGAGACTEDHLRETAYAYCDGGAALWDDVGCTHGGCPMDPIEGLVTAVYAKGCACELIAYYDCEMARFAAEDTTKCTCEGGSTVVCPDEELCAALKDELTTCIGS